MSMVGGFDVHRNQITFDYLDTGTGEVRTGKIRPATRDALRAQWYASGLMPAAPWRTWRTKSAPSVRQGYLELQRALESRRGSRPAGSGDHAAYARRARMLDELQSRLLDD